MGIPPTKPGTGVNKTESVTESNPLKQAQKVARVGGDSSRAGRGVESDRRADGAAMKARVQTAVDARKGYEVGEKAVGLMDETIQQGGKAIQARAAKTLSELQDTQNTLISLDRRMKQVGAAMEQIDSPSELGRFSKLSEEMGELAEARNAVVRKLDKAEAALEGLQSQLKAGDALSSTSADVQKGLEDAKGLRRATGKLLFGLDVLSKYQEFAQKDPANAGKNMTKAVTTALAGLQDLGLSDRTSASEAAVALLKFGLETAGMKGTDTYTAVDLASQAFPGDIVGKGIGQAVELGYAGIETLTTGDIKRLEKLNTANLKGDNGAVVQGMAIIGDLMATGGRDIPTDDKSLYFRDFFQGLLTERGQGAVSSGTYGGEKAQLMRSLMDGANTPGDDVIQIQDIVSKGKPSEIARALDYVPTGDLVKALHPYAGQHSDPLAGTVNDLLKVAGEATAPADKAKLYDKALGLLAYGIAQGRGDSIKAVKADNVPADIQVRLNRLVRQAQ